nr:tyrosine kinase {catalytic domain, clone Xltk35, subdomain VIII} [Xenopus laevis, Peptide Partial, 26 aa] [Xenopus laevis]
NDETTLLVTGFSIKEVNGTDVWAFGV